MTEHEIRSATDQQLARRLTYLRAETTEGRQHYGTAALRQMRAEREAIVAELDYRRAEAVREAYEARMMAGRGEWA